MTMFLCTPDRQDGPPATPPTHDSYLVPVNTNSVLVAWIHNFQVFNLDNNLPGKIGGVGSQAQPGVHNTLKPAHSRHLV